MNVFVGMKLLFIEIIRQQQQNRNYYMGSSLQNQHIDNSVQSTRANSLNLKQSAFNNCSVCVPVLNQKQQHNIRRSSSNQGTLLGSRNISLSQKSKKKFLSLTKSKDSLGIKGQNNIKEATRDKSFLRSIKPLNARHADNKLSPNNLKYNIIAYEQRPIIMRKQIAYPNSQIIRYPNFPKYHMGQVINRIVPRPQAIHNNINCREPINSPYKLYPQSEESNVFPYYLKKQTDRQKEQNVQLQKKTLKKVPIALNPTINQVNIVDIKSQIRQTKNQQSYAKYCQESQQPNKQNSQEHILTDPLLYQYITSNRKIKSLKPAQSKYAVAISNHDIKPMSSIIQQNTKTNIKSKYSSSKLHSDQTDHKLEFFVQKQTTQKARDQYTYKFPTLSEFSEQYKSDNTSFIPVKKGSALINSQINSQELLAYCKPKIDEKVISDMLRLTFKSS